MKKKPKHKALSPRYCSACGAEHEPGALFCARCGRVEPRADGSIPDLGDDSTRRRRLAAFLAYRQKRFAGCSGLLIGWLLTLCGIGFLVYFLSRS